MFAKVKCAAVIKVTRVIIPLVTEVVLERDKSEKVTKTNVWVKIKRKGKYLQGFEDYFKKTKKGNSCFKQQGLRTQ